MKSFIFAILAVLVMGVCVCTAAPEPAIVPGPSIWTVDVKFEHPQQIMLPRSGQRRPQRFWYTILTLTNNTGDDVDFYPKFELMTDTFQILPASQKTPPMIFEMIKTRHENRYLFHESLKETSSKILQGKDNTKDIAVIWPDFDPKAKNITLFMTGLSNETAVVYHPTAKDENGMAKKIFLRKTLELKYSLGGDPAFRSDVTLLDKGRRWIIR